MLFNSLSYALFLPVVFILYWLINKGKLTIQNALLLAASYFFYAVWDWRFLLLLIFSTLLDYFTGIKMSNTTTKTQKRFWFWLSITINVGLLCVFKYYDFFAISFAEAAAEFGWKVDVWTLDILLPVGISFYTFHGLSYVIDIYNDKIKPEKNFISYAVFVSFFPLLVAGPIERATHLLPQIVKPRTFNYGEAVLGMRQILWGLFKKIAIADMCAEYVDLIYSNISYYNSSTLFIGAVLFNVQSYCDFSGYSDIALGTARLFGINLMRNFAFPYFSRNIAEFWRRWHISLSSWFKDYLYIPLGGSRHGKFKTIINLYIIFMVSGLWHGANWTFVFWGALNATYIIPSVLFNGGKKEKDIVSKGKLIPSIRDLYDLSVTFILVAFCRIFFRADTITQAFDYIINTFSKTIFEKPNLFSLPLTLLILFTFLIEWIGREQSFGIQNMKFLRTKTLRWSAYIILIILIIIFQGKQAPFIYFQF